MRRGCWVVMANGIGPCRPSATMLHIQPNPNIGRSSRRTAGLFRPTWLAFHRSILPSCYEVGEYPLFALSGYSLQSRVLPLRVDCVEKLRLIGASATDSVLLGTGDSADDGRAAGDAGGAVLPLSPERHVPDDHLLRKTDCFVDLSDLRAHLGAVLSDVGRPSIDPELMMRT